MDRLGNERNEAVKERDEAYKDADEWRGKYEAEIRRRIEAEAKAATAEATNTALSNQIGLLTQEVVQLRQEVASLRQLATGGGTGGAS